MLRKTRPQSALVHLISGFSAMALASGFQTTFQMGIRAGEDVMKKAD